MGDDTFGDTSFATLPKTDGELPTYENSHSARTDKWYQEIRELRAQLEALERYVNAHRMFSDMIDEAGITLPPDTSRDIARAEFKEFSAKRVGQAQQLIKRKLTRIETLEYNGVED